MSILPKLIAYYRSQGLNPLSGYNSYHMYNHRDAPFTVFQQGQGLVGSPGLALQEIMFLEHLNKYLAPRNCLIIGNAMGWSTLATALIFPNGRTVAMDNKPGTGIEFTNAAFRELALDGGAVLGESPGDVSAVAEKELTGPVDFALIDAIHNNEAIQVDFNAVRKVASVDCVYIFHDVINWTMMSGFKALLANSGLKGLILTRTPSGMAVAFASSISAECQDYMEAFSDDPTIFRKYREHLRIAVEKLETITDRESG